MSIVSRTAFAIALGTLGFAGQARAQITVMENHKTLEVDCAKDPEVSLVGNHITLTTKGVCDKISVTGNHETVTGSAKSVGVTGNHNTVSLDAADDVAVMGNNNTVTVRAAVSRKTPKIGNVGRENKITRPK